jgi:hypothetical protein
LGFTPLNSDYAAIQLALQESHLLPQPPKATPPAAAWILQPDSPHTAGRAGAWFRAPKSSKGRSDRPAGFSRTAQKAPLLGGSTVFWFLGCRLGRATVLLDAPICKEASRVVTSTQPCAPTPETGIARRAVSPRRAISGHSCVYPSPGARVDACAYLAAKSVYQTPAKVP